MQFIKLEGNTPYETGIIHGKLLKDEIDRLINSVQEQFKKKYGKFSFNLFKNFLLLYSTYTHKYIPKRYILEMEGIANGSNQPFKWILLTNKIYDIGIHFSRFINWNNCSAFISNYKNTNYTILAKTTDVPITLASILYKNRVCFIYKTQWINKNYLTLSFPGCISGDSFILEDGSFIGFNGGGTFFKKSNMKNLPFFIYTKECIYKMDNINNLDKILKNTMPTRPYICFASKGLKRNTFLIETANGNNYKRKFEHNLIITNHFKNSDMIKKIYKKNHKKNKYYIGSKMRYINLEKNMSKSLNLKKSINLLELHENTFGINKGSIANKQTAHGLIYYPKRKILYIPKKDKITVTYKNVWEKYYLDNLFSL